MKYILLVDDDPDIQLLHSAQLEAAGYRVRSACDGASCVLAARRDCPDLVILDLGLPAGDGESALREMRALPELAEVPVLVFSARESADWEDHVCGLGANGYLQKPVFADRLVWAVQELIGGAVVPDRAV